MADKIEIQISFLNRRFPIEISPEEEPLIEEAVGIIRKKIENFQKQYSIKDDIYLTLMVCLDIAHDYVILKNQKKGEKEKVDGDLEELTRLIKDTLSEEDK